MPIKTADKWNLPSLINSLECKPEKPKVFKWSQIFNTYTNFIFQYPLLIFIVCFLVCTIVPIFVLTFYPVQLDNNPEKVRIRKEVLNYLEF
jgi:hypothetical protein